MLCKMRASCCISTKSVRYIWRDHSHVDLWEENLVKALLVSDSELDIAVSWN